MMRLPWFILKDYLLIFYFETPAKGSQAGAHVAPVVHDAVAMVKKCHPEDATAASTSGTCDCSR
jgi:hypothetical protein